MFPLWNRVLKAPQVGCVSEHWIPVWNLLPRLQQRHPGSKIKPPGLRARCRPTARVRKTHLMQWKHIELALIGCFAWWIFSAFSQLFYVDLFDIKQLLLALKFRSNKSPSGMWWTSELYIYVSHEWTFPQHSTCMFIFLYVYMYAYIYIPFES